MLVGDNWGGENGTPATRIDVERGSAVHGEGGPCGRAMAVHGGGKRAYSAQAPSSVYMVHFLGCSYTLITAVSQTVDARRRLHRRVLARSPGTSDGQRKVGESLAVKELEREWMAISCGAVVWDLDGGREVNSGIDWIAHVTWVAPFYNPSKPIQSVNNKPERDNCPT